MQKSIRKTAILVLVCYLLLMGIGQNRQLYAEVIVKESREYFSIGYKVQTDWNKYRKISGLITLPEVVGLGEELAVNSKGEAAYNYLGVETEGSTIDFGFYKSPKTQRTWKLFSYYVTKDQKTAEEAYEFIEKRFPRSSGQYYSKPYYKVWSEYREFSVPDNTKVFVQLYVSDKDEITINVKYDDQDIKIPYRFKGANNKGAGIRFRRESNLLAYGEQGKIDGKMDARWEKVRVYDEKKSYAWLSEGFFYRDDANRDKGLPLNIQVIKRDLPYLEIISYGQMQ